MERIHETHHYNREEEMANNDAIELTCVSQQNGNSALKYNSFLQNQNIMTTVRLYSLLCKLHLSCVLQQEITQIVSIAISLIDIKSYHFAIVSSFAIQYWMYR